MDYTIEWLERKTTKTGKNFLSVSLKDPDGKTINNVAIWEGFPGFDELQTGYPVLGNLVVKENGQFVNVTLYPPRDENRITRKSGAIQQAMERKETSIKKFQDEKELGMRISAANRDATLIVTTFYLELTEQKDKEAAIKAEWKKWRDFFFSSSEKVPF